MKRTCEDVRGGGPSGSGRVHGEWGGPVYHRHGDHPQGKHRLHLTPPPQHHLSPE